MDVGETLVRIRSSTFFSLFLNFNTIFQIIALGPFKFNFQLHTFFWEKGHKILLRLRPPKWLSRPCVKPRHWHELKDTVNARVHIMILQHI
ncbi:hypothetical protein Hanom_Chr05g00472671 [Helianthus anomalus]